jgi:hypothetical protein
MRSQTSNSFILYYTITMETSPKFSLKNLNRKKIGIGALMALIGALLTFLAELIPTIDFGMWTPMVTMLFSIITNVVRKRMFETTEALPK